MENGLPEFLVEARSIFWIWKLIFRGQTCKVLSQTTTNSKKHFSKCYQFLDFLLLIWFLGICLWNMLENICGHFWSLFESIWYICPRNMNITFKRSIFLQHKVLEARIWAPNSASSQYFERQASISNVRPRCRTPRQYLERPANISNVQPVVRTPGQDFWTSGVKNNMKTSFWTSIG